YYQTKNLPGQSFQVESFNTTLTIYFFRQSERLSNGKRTDLACSFQVSINIERGILTEHISPPVIDFKVWIVRKEFFYRPDGTSAKFLCPAKGIDYSILNDQVRTN